MKTLKVKEKDFMFFNFNLIDVVFFFFKKMFEWHNKGFGLAMEYLDLENLNSFSGDLGERLARLG